MFRSKKQTVPAAIAATVLGKKKQKTSRKKKGAIALVVGSAVATGVSALTKPKNGSHQ